MKFIKYTLAMLFMGALTYDAGAYVPPDRAKPKMDEKVITGHVGLLESIHMIASGLGWDLDEAVELPPEPMTSSFSFRLS